ncbi:hypothetical protein [Asticcacaulis sp. YBE204]|uniref:hypothetical protein n=1 Tax=Asticcacaulis sp. YBE204 TaxID=1282363 RepID=UPI0003C3E6A2|nr:hypothetical protein [Asticcacaulis sp. YBE204]ESQ79740.1 hypothetical protein AEYBE204_07810 [Asticcacaulis sp. YBE204]
MAADLPDPKSPNYRELALRIGNKGTIYQTVRLTRTENKNGKVTTTSSTSAYRNDFTAIEGGYKVKKTLTAFTVTGPDGKTIDKDAHTQDAVLLRTMTGTLGDLTFIGDESLAPQRLENWPALWANTRALIAAGLREGGRPSLEEEVKVMNMMDGMFGKLTPEQAAGSFLQADTIIAVPHNLALEIEKPLTADSEIIVPIGNFPLQVSETVIITHWNAAGNTAQVIYDYRPKSDSLKAFFYDFLPKFMKDAGAPAEALAEMMSAMKANPGNVFDMSTHCDYDMAIDTGLVRQGKCTRITTVSLMGQTSGKTEIYDVTESFVP